MRDRRRYRPIRNSVQLVHSGLRQHRAQPPRDLAPYVEEFWQYDVQPGVAYVPTQIYPSGCVLLRFNIWPERVESLLYGPSMAADMKGCFIGGTEIFGAAFRADRAYPVLGVGVHELTDLRLDLEHFWPRRIDELHDRLRQTQTFSERVPLMSAFIRCMLRERLRVHADFLNAFESLVRPRGNHTLEDIARRQAVSIRTLRRQFEKYAGLSPKQVARMARVQHVLGCIARAPAAPLADLAVVAGFSDQAHLTREFKRLLGVSPMSFKGLLRRLHDPALPIWRGLRPDDYFGPRPPPVIAMTQRAPRAPRASCLNQRNPEQVLHAW